MVHETLRSWEPSSYQLVCVRGRSEGATVFTGYLWFSRGGLPTEEQQATSEYRDGPTSSSPRLDAARETPMGRMSGPWGACLSRARVQV